MLGATANPDLVGVPKLFQPVDHPENRGVPTRTDAKIRDDPMQMKLPARDIMAFVCVRNRREQEWICLGQRRIGCLLFLGQFFEKFGDVGHRDRVPSLTVDFGTGDGEVFQSVA